MRSLLFFDLDDTLLDHTGAEAEAQRETFSAFGTLFGGVAFAEWLAAYRNANAGLWAAYGRAEIGRDELHRRRFADPLAAFGLDRGAAEEVGTAYLERYRRAWRLNDGAEELLAAAADLGEVGILSNGFRELQRAKIARFGLDRWVRHVVLSEEVGAMKPARAIFDAAVRAACGEGSADGRRKLYLGDHFEADVVGARRAGWFPVLYNPGRLPLPGPVLHVARLTDAIPLLA
ncbi:MAG: HAD-IA family hydrolase [Holophagales bacterium]|nr:HAD-IA family hydrolase [Holophagales bacterium]